jgi:putative ubiquitin-RnfH superfamily antitoxin RatB of RatAB toxin-antitoxin module
MEVIMDKIDVEVAYALPDHQVILPVELSEGQTAEDAIHASGIEQRFEGIDLNKNKIGIFGKAAKLDYVLNNHDRVEIYRPITCDPKEVRRQRAKKVNK